MVDRPIIFSGPMVRAILDGRKTQTRRLIRDELPAAPAFDNVHPNHKPRHPAPYLDAYCGERKTTENPRGMGPNWCWWTRDDRCGSQFRVGYVPGDRLWVREAWCHTGQGVWGVRQSYVALDGKVIYRADDDGSDPGIKWFSPIHLSRARSRLTLTVTDVRVQRLQEISEPDARAEGIMDGGCVSCGIPEPCGCASPLPSAKDAFARLWNSLHGPDAWTTNPWVVALTFTVEQRNIDASPSPRPNNPEHDHDGR